MDEMVIAGRAFTADEIQRMYREGQPQTVGQFASRSMIHPPAEPIGPGVELVCDGGFEKVMPGKDLGMYHAPYDWNAEAGFFQAYTGLPHGGQFRGTAFNEGIGTQTHLYENGFAPDGVRLAYPRMGENGGPGYCRRRFSHRRQHDRRHAHRP